jgi:iron complex outermembrane receptor protein
MRNWCFRSAWPFLGACMAAGGLSSASAQTASPSADPLAIEEIVVTVQKRTEQLSDVPISVGVIRGTEIAEAGIRNLEEIASRTPGFHVNQSPAQSGIFIRSVGSGSNNQGFEQSVGLFIDGIYAGRERLFQAPFLDIERIEVIKGPQNVLLGKNTTAGAISITTARPTRDFMAEANGLYGEDGEYAATAIVSGPLSDTTAIRLAARASGMSGYLKNSLTGKREPRINDQVGRGTVLFQPSDDLEFLLKGEVARSRTRGSPLIATQLTAGQLGLARQFNPTFSTDLDSKSKASDGALLPNRREYNDVDSQLVSLTGNWNVRDWTLTSVTGWAGYKFRQGTDADTLPIPVAAVALSTGSRYSQISQELRVLSPQGETIEMMGGLYYQSSDVKYQDWIPCVDFASVPPANLPANFCTPSRFGQDQDTASAFARATWNVSQQLRATAGVRYTLEKKVAANRLTVTELDLTTLTTSPFEIAVANALGGWVTHAIPTTRRREASWSPSANIQYDVTPDAMVYFSFNQGTKGGGFNPLEGKGDITTWEFDEEKARAFEIGAKARLFGGRVTANLAAFLSTFKDLQVSQFNGVTFDVSNAASADVNGVEGDIAVRVTEALTLHTALAYLDSRYDDFTTAPCMAGQTPATGCVGGFQNLSGQPMTFAPKWSGMVGLDLTQPLTDALTATARFDMEFTGDQYIGPDNDPRVFQKGFAKVNMTLALGASDQGWEVAVIGKNLTDKVTKAFENDIIGYSGAFFAHVLRGRSFAVRVSAKL